MSTSPGSGMPYALLDDLSRTLARGDRECVNVTARFVVGARMLGYRARPLATVVVVDRGDGTQETITMGTPCDSDEWSGHMVAVVDESLLVDCTVGQFDGNSTLVADEALTVPVDPAWLSGLVPLVVDRPFPWADRITYTAVPHPADWPFNRSTWSRARQWVRDHM